MIGEQVRDDRFGLSQGDLSAAVAVAIGAEANAIARAVRLDAAHQGDVSAL